MFSPHERRELERSRSHVDHDHPHPNGSHAHRGWAREQVLHVAVMYSNPCRWRTRMHLFNDFRRHAAQLPNVRLYVGELAYGERPFEVTSAEHPHDFQWRTRDVLWHKENVLARVIERFDPGWEYGAWCDGDAIFTRNDVALETIHQLQRYDWVQMYSSYADLSADHRPLRVQKSFAHRYVRGEIDSSTIAARGLSPSYYGGGTRRPSVGTTGLAWAFRREAFEAVGGLLETCILGSADWHMAFGLVGEPDSHPNVAELTRCGVRYAESIKAWQDRAARAARKNVGVVDCHAIHHFHGSKQNRGYGVRWKILRDQDFDPYHDLHRDAQGIWQLRPDRIALRDEIRRYFDSRTEDDPTLKEGDRLIGE